MAFIGVLKLEIIIIINVVVVQYQGGYRKKGSSQIPVPTFFRQLSTGN